MSAPGPEAPTDSTHVDSIAEFLTSARLLSRALNAALAEDGLREDPWRVLHALSRSHGLLMGEIAESLALPAATTTRLIDDLTDLGLVFRRAAPDDGRKAVVYLSRIGEDRLARLNAVISARLPLPETVPFQLTH